MKLGSFLPLQSNLFQGAQPQNKQGAQVSAPERSTGTAADADAKSHQHSSNVLPYAEFVEAAERLAATQAVSPQESISEGVLFNHNRDLPFTSQSALAAYMTNESFQTFSQGELVGVDVYV